MYKRQPMFLKHILVPSTLCVFPYLNSSKRLGSCISTGFKTNKTQNSKLKKAD